MFLGWLYQKTITQLLQYSPQIFTISHKQLYDYMLRLMLVISERIPYNFNYYMLAVTLSIKRFFAVLHSTSSVNNQMFYLL